MIKNTLILLVVIQTIVLPQNLDSLYNRLLGLKPTQNVKVNTIQSINTKPEKCGFGLVTEIRAHIKEFSIEQQQSIEQILSRPTLQKSIVSPSGIFRIHYDTTGSNTPDYISGKSVTLNINEIAIAFDLSYNFEVNILGYLPPPKDGAEGGDDKYDIYIMNIRDYGYTDPEESLGNNKHTSYIVIDNSFSKNENYNTFGIQAARATAAHEFHHAIQMGYRLNFDDTYYHELTSTAMEEAVYDDVNDYYFYIPSFFSHTDRSFINQTGYDLALWNIYLRERFGGNAPNTGDKIIKRSWELMAAPHNNRGIVALAKAMNELGYSFKQELNKFATWIYFTDYRTKSNEYFEEAEFYPLVKETSNILLKPTNMPLTINSNPVSINFLSFLNEDNGLSVPDTLFAILSNSDVEGASSSNSSFDFSLTIATNSFNGANAIADSYYSKIEGSSSKFISDSYIINGELASSFVSRTNIDFAYPQPFVYESIISIPTYADVSGKAELNIYSTDMNLVFSGKQNIIKSGNIVVTWNGLDEHNNKLASGVYIYVTKADGKIKKGKIVILNK